MAQVKLLKIDALGIPTEFNSAADDITLNSFTAGAGPVISPSGVDMNNTDVSDIQDLVFNAPSTATINQTAGNLIIDDIMAKERENLMTTSGGISFPVISDVAGEVDAFRLPSLAGAPTAAPASAGSGHLVYDTTNNNLYVWDGAAWDNLNTVSVANNLDNAYTAEVAVAARDVVYVSSADSVSPAQANSNATSGGTIGFAVASASAAASVEVRSNGLLSGFSGLTPGARYYLSADTAGAITPTVPTGSGNLIILCAVAKSATQVQVRIEDLGRRA